eukprot:gene4426-8814_t
MTLTLLCIFTFLLTLNICTSFSPLPFLTLNKLSLKSLKYDPSSFIEVSISKPLGLVLEEVELNKKKGVYVGDCAPGGKAAAVKTIYPGLFLIEVNGINVKSYDFDSVMDILINAPLDQNIKLVFVDPRSVEKGPANINVKLPDGRTALVSCLKGQNLREVLLGANIDVYDMKGKLTNCSGGGQCGTCVVEVTAKDWEDRPEFETRKLKKYSPNARLSCNTIVEGDADITELASFGNFHSGGMKKPQYRKISLQQNKCTIAILNLEGGVYMIVLNALFVPQTVPAKKLSDFDDIFV